MSELHRFAHRRSLRIGAHQLYPRHYALTAVIWEGPRVLRKDDFVEQLRSRVSGLPQRFKKGPRHLLPLRVYHADRLTEEFPSRSIWERDGSVPS
jgi:hypothetical protein